VDETCPDGGVASRGDLGWVVCQDLAEVAGALTAIPRIKSAFDSGHSALLGCSVFKEAAAADPYQGYNRAKRCM